jgi:hypothetical protein
MWRAPNPIDSWRSFERPHRPILQRQSLRTTQGWTGSAGGLEGLEFGLDSFRRISGSASSRRLVAFSREARPFPEAEDFRGDGGEEQLDSGHSSGVGDSERSSPDFRWPPSAGELFPIAEATFSA